MAKFSVVSKKQRFLNEFLFRWFVSSLGLAIAAGLLGDRVDFGRSFTVIVIAGLMLALLNTIIKPFVIFITLPVLILSFGLFTIVINGLMVLLASRLYDDLHVTNFTAAMLAGMVIGLVNYIVVTIVE